MFKLTALNTMLASIAQAPENSAESRNPYAIAAIAVLDRINTEVQEMGWWFNTDTNVTLSPTDTQEIRLPESTLRIIDRRNRMNFVARNGKLYNPINHTSKFTQPVVVDIVQELPFEYTPEAAAQYIMRKSVLEFFSDRDGEASKLSKMNNDVAMAWARLSSEGIRQLGVSSADSPHYTAFLGRMTNSRALATWRFNRSSSWETR